MPAIMILGLKDDLRMETAADDEHMVLRSNGLDVSIILGNYSPELVHEFLETVKAAVRKANAWNISRDEETDEKADKEQIVHHHCSAISDDCGCA